LTAGRDISEGQDELPVEAGLADARLADHRCDLTVVALCSLEGEPDLLNLRVATDEACEPARGGFVEA
jgi:hypothetical protein